ncbi:selenocysteine insertion sequence-binding protein 2 isoform X2 [Kryptolebias marmoratus]|uniref:selenocysteine insertion sequence-binding protein 2 isoform X2 n=1 Tax=Kryptolebias marmoratus TaxID=37003 RepID=UPI0007F89B67|nr:selenocysteine insertion sequence-binding protein 2 isoform X2 [Kryptolebias marmoratus]
MDKESELTSSAWASDHRHQRRPRREADGPHTASAPLILPNPTLTRNRSDFGPKSAGRGGDGSRSHGYSSHRPRAPQAKASKSCNDSQGKNSVDAQKKGFDGPRKPTQADSVPFEVKMADFPELSGDPQPKSAQEEESWGPGCLTASPRMQTPTTSWKADTRGSAAKVPVSPAARSVPTSWANVASQPPKHQPVLPDRTVGGALQTKEDEGTGKKRRRKKKKVQSCDEGAEAEEPINPLEPPKFEDEEEFPGLAVASAASERFILSSKTKLCSEENQREVGQHQSVDPNMEKFSSGKAQPSEAAKRGQKAEKVSGKKSKAPVQLDIGNMLAALEKKQQSQKSKQDAKPVVLSVGGGLPVVQRQPSAPKKPLRQQEKFAHNPLDSTSPSVKKGKQREVPKAKKPTPLKKVILKEREERKQKRLLEERGPLPEDESKPADEENDAAGSVDDDEDEQPLGTASVVEGDDEGADKEESVQPEAAPAELQQADVLKIHSRKFRDYCSQVLSKDLDECVTSLLKELVRFQDRLYQKDPMKARMKRRIVMGLREVLKHLKLRKVKCVIISPNCERIQSKGGLDEALHTIISMCREQSVPFVFALSRRALGRCVNKAVPVSLVGIFNYDGAQDYYHRMIELSSEASRAYEVKLSSLERTGPPVPGEDSAGGPIPGPEEAEESEEPPEEPEYIRFWKKVLEKKSSYTFLNFEEQLRSLHLDTECGENTEEEEQEEEEEEEES